MTSASAGNFGLSGRGLVREGYYADLCVFDPATVADTATFEAPVSPAAGIEMTICNGVPVWQGGKATGRRPGRVLRLQELKAEALTRR
jgi:N-acyl-D-amino-acid deacylase